MEQYMRKFLFITAGLLYLSLSAFAQHPTYDDQKEKQWKSMENGPWDFAPAWYYYLLHKKYSCLLYTSPSPRDISGSRMPSSA